MLNKQLLYKLVLYLRDDVPQQSLPEKRMEKLVARAIFNYDYSIRLRNPLENGNHVELSPFR